MNVHSLLGKRALVTRGSAQGVLAALQSEASAGASTTLDLDFSGVEAVAPSFVDELISGLSVLTWASFHELRILQPPSRLSEKFRAIGRSRGLAMEEGSQGEWIIALMAGSGRD